MNYFILYLAIGLGVSLARECICLFYLTSILNVLLTVLFWPIVLVNLYSISNEAVENKKKEKDNGV